MKARFTTLFILLLMGHGHSKAQTVDTIAIDSAIQVSYNLLSKNIDSAMLVAKNQVEVVGNDSLRRAKLLWLIGIAHQLKLENDEALLILKEAFELIKGTNNQQESRILSQLGGVYFTIGSLTNSVHCYKKALDLAIAEKDVYMIAYIQKELGRVLYANDKYNEAIFYGEKSYEYFKDQGDIKNRIDILTLMGLSWMEVDSIYAISNDYLKEALDLSVKIDDSLKINISKNNYSKLLLINNEIDKALQYYLESEKYIRQKSLVIYLGPVLINIGNIHLKKDNLEKAEKYLLEGLEYTKAHKQNNHTIKAYKHLTHLFKKSGDELKRLSYKVELLKTEKKVHELNDEAFQKADSILHDLKLEQMENEILQAKNAVNDQKIKNQTLVNSVISVTIAFFIILLIINVVKQRKIKKQKEELDLLNQTKDRIISILSHDLRAPLGQIISLQKMISSDDIDIDQKKNLEAKLVQRTEQSLSMVDGILFWAKNALNNNSAEIKISVKLMVDEAIMQVFDTIQMKNLEFNSEIDDTFINTNPQLFKIVIRNILSNARKFTPENGKISIIGKSTNSFYEIRVKDSGVGFNNNIIVDINSKSSAKTLSSTIGTSGEPGNGLGLMLSKDFVETMGGKLSIEKSSEKGSTILIQLPL